MVCSLYFVVRLFCSNILLVFILSFKIVKSVKIMDIGVCIMYREWLIIVSGIS